MAGQKRGDHDEEEAESEGENCQKARVEADKTVYSEE